MNTFPNHSVGSSSSKPFDTDVLIVGAGPIGLILACALARHGVSFRIIEQKEGPSTDSKAHNLIARSQEFLAALDLLEPIRKQAHPTAAWKIALDQKPIAELSFKNSPTNYAYWLFSSQKVFEKSFNEQLKARGIAVERGVRFDSLAQDGDSVTATIIREDRPEKIRAKYLVGADGVKGLVRKSIGLDFELKEMKGKATWQIDADLTWRRSTDHDKVWFFLYRDGFAGFLPVWNHTYRLFIIEDQDQRPARPPTREEMEKRAQEISGDPTLRLTNPTWYSHGTFKQGVAKAYAKGRVFLAGDAGHDALPIGGQGMNTGVHDAVGLAWRLAMTISTNAPKIVLDSYGIERRESHAVKNKQQVAGFNSLVYRGRFTDFALRLIGNLFPSLIRRAFGVADMQQLDVAYPNSPLSEDRLAGALRLRQKSIRAGSRAPDPHLVDGDGKRVSLHQFLARPARFTWEWTLLSFDGGMAASADHAAVTGLVEKFPWIKVARIESLPAGRSQPREESVFFDHDEDAHAAFGLRGRPALLLIRPDAHIAYRGRTDDLGGLRAYLKKLSNNPAPELRL